MTAERNWLDRRPLRVVLVALMVALMAAGLLATGAAVTAVMRDQLLARVDASLDEAAGTWAHRPPPGEAGPPELPPEGTEGQPPNRGRPPTQYYVAVYDGSGTLQFVANDHSTAPDIGDAIALEAGRAFTAGSVPARGGSGDTSASRAVESDPVSSWRVLADDSAEARTVLAVPLDDSVDRTVEMLAIVQGAVGLVVLAVVGIGGARLIRRSMRPLKEVEAASADLASGNLSRRLPPRPGNTEVGSLTRSFNEMATRIEAAFAEVRSSEAAARDSEEAARRSEERMRRFIADAGHELRTPLTSIRGFAELHDAGGVPADFALDRIGSESRRMVGLVEDLLTLAHLDAERPMENKLVDVVSVVADSIDAVSAIDPDRPVETDVAAAPQILGDAGKLQQAVLNLLANAVRHTPAGTPIRVAVAIEDRQALPAEAAMPAIPAEAAVSKMASITVADEGPGMTAEEAAHVFGRFNRLDESRTRGDGGGSGLGLSIAEGIAEAHGGSIGVVTAPGEGAAFTIRIPLHDDAVPER